MFLIPKWASLLHNSQWDHRLLMFVLITFTFYYYSSDVIRLSRTQYSAASTVVRKQGLDIIFDRLLKKFLFELKQFKEPLIYLQGGA